MKMKRSKISRNQSCPCKSGLKYKKCCGKIINNQNAFRNPYPRPLPEEFITAMRRHEANELIRQQQQGLGKQIISFKISDQQMVVVGDTIYSSSQWKTFPDFLISYLSEKLGKDWVSLELSKPLQQRHTILKWYDEYRQFQNTHKNKDRQTNFVKSVGVVSCYLGMAYNLYLLEHNVELQERLIRRLKIPEQFQGAYYELIVANCLIRAGFDLVLENEEDHSKKHCEFAAISKRTGKKYWVEAKMRSVEGMFGKTKKDGSSDTEKSTSAFIRHLNKALKKPAENERLIFIDINAEPALSYDTLPNWAFEIEKILCRREKSLKLGESAYVFTTNMCFHRRLQDEQAGFAIMVYGLGISDFCKVGRYRCSEIYKRKQKHIDAHNISNTLKNYPQLPSTFDGRMPSTVFGHKFQPPIVGEKYLFENSDGEQITGVITCATVDEVRKLIYIFITADDGSCKLQLFPIPDDALVDYKNHSDSFFGIVKKVPKTMKSRYDAFEFFLNSFCNASKDVLLENMKDAKDIDILQRMDRSDLLLEYCDRMADNPELKFEK